MTGSTPRGVGPVFARLLRGNAVGAYLAFAPSFVLVCFGFFGVFAFLSIRCSSAGAMSR
jgi:hypothetical protein